MKPKRIISLLLAICLVAGLMPTVAFATGSDKAIMLDTGNISGYDSTNGYDYIYYGTWNSSPIKWRVLDTKTNMANATEGDGLFLLSDVLLGTGTNGRVYFDNTEPYSNAWQGSYAQAWCSTFYSKNLTPQEQDAVLATTKSDEKFTSSTYIIPFAASENILNGDKVFFLSAKEAETSGYGFRSDNDRKVNYESSAGYWWLRSPDANYMNSAGVVNPYGQVDHNYVHFDRAARPAFNLNLNSVLFTSAAEGGKSSGAVGADALQPVSEYARNEWKLTLLDGNRRFTASTSSATTQTQGYSNWTVEVTYYGAQTGSNEYVSAMLVDGSGSVLYYGRVAQNRVSGTANITIPDGLAAGNYTLKVFSEQYNGDKITDYASAFEDIDLHVHSLTLTQKVDATCTTAGKEAYYTCQTCGKHFSDASGANEIENLDNYGNIPAKDHTWSNWTSSGNDEHTHTCSVCQASETESCSGGEATCTNKAVCSTCNTEYGEVNPDNHTGQPSWVQNADTHKKVYSCCNAEISEAENHSWENGVCTVCQYPCTHTGGEATCMSKAVCTICNSQYGELDPDNHNPASEWTQEDGKHYHICQNGCGTHLDEANCDGGTATCISKANCSVCGHEYGGYGAHDLTAHDYKAPTCTETGNIQYWECSVCNKLFSDAQGNTETKIADVTIAVKDHTPGADWKYNDSTHWKLCVNCSAKVDEAAHDYENGVCKVCNAVQPTYAITASPETLDFGSETEGYADAPAAQIVTITNIGNQSVTVNLPTSATYTITAGTEFESGTATLAPNGTAAFTVQPKTGLGAGDYSETLAISGSNGTNANVQLSFAVTETAPVTYTLTVELKGGSGSTTGGEYAEGAVIHIDAGSRSNYRFTGWTTSSGGNFADASSASTTFTMPAADTTITANWEYNGGGNTGGSTTDYYRLTFDVNGGSEIASILRAEYTTVDLSDYKPTREGYEFTGWYADKDLTDKITSIRLTRNTTVYAGWEEKKENPGTGFENPFTDISENDWFYDDVMFVFANDLMVGTGDATFSPEISTSRAMIAVTLWRMEGEPEPKGANPYTDVENGAWYTEAITWANENGIAEGYGNGCFQPETPVTREQLAAFFYRYAEYKGYDITITGSLDHFNDKDNVSEWAKDTMAWAVGYGLIGGKGNNMLDPQGEATRAEFAAMLQRFCQKG